MTFQELQASLFVFGLGERATLKEIKARHRELVKRYHPDAGEAHDPLLIRKVNEAYRVLLGYVESYRYSFAEEEFYEQDPEARLRHQFMDDPLWGGKG
jgi:DnaJ-class molecular chaperone